jgi:hypothetical protein
MHFLIRRTFGLWWIVAATSLGACSWFATDGDDPGTGGGGPFPPVGGGTGFFGTSRTLEPLVIAEDPPPAISGGTLYYSAGSELILAADPDRDAVFVIDATAVGTAQPLARVAFEPGDEPGRIGEAGGRFWVVLRSAGAVSAIDPADWSTERFDVCPTPRGIAGQGEALHIACESGELVTLNAATGAEARRVALGPDLRDVVVANDGLYVSQFRRPAVLEVDGAGDIVSKTTLSPVNGFEPSVAYQMVAHPDAGVLVVHQYGNTTQVPFEPEPNAYGQSGCAAINLLGVARVVDGVATQGQFGAVTLPVSLATYDFGLAVVDAGSLNDGSLTSAFETDDGVLVGEDVDVQFDVGSFTTQACDTTARSVFWDTEGHEFRDGRQIVAVASTPLGIWVQSRDPWQVVGPAVEVSLPGPNPKDTGHDLFHERAGASVACATCHAEGGDDGLVWQFDGLVPRRSHDLRGGILATAPFHWDGAHEDMSALMSDSFTTRMSGPLLDTSYAGAVASWIDSRPMPPAPLDPLDADVLAGKAIFERAEVACTSCHAAPLFTNHQTVDVGTGGPFQVPSLVGVSHRVAYLHDGCAEDLEAAIRGASCAATENAPHGDISSLGADELDQLVAYLRSL